VHAVPTTLGRTTLGEMAPGRRVNLERAVRAGEPLGGHLVQGHVDAVGEIVGVDRDEDALVLRVRLPAEVEASTVERGSLTVDGVSLTVADLEISMGLALLGSVMMAGSLSLTAIVEAQGEVWYIVPQFVGFLIFMVAGFAETSRAPFDLPEADAELVAGYQTEYGGMRWGTFMMAEYIEMFVVSGIAATFFLGGWMGPGPGFLDPIWMLVKILALMFVFFWIRATLPRVRYDQLMSFGWKIALPIATLNVLVTAVLVTVL
jgi:hypothetical protein